MTDRERLAEATALLERAGTGDVNEWDSQRRAFLSRAPAQPAAPTATFEHPGAEAVFQRLQSTCGQPAAPTLEIPAATDVCPQCSRVFHRPFTCSSCGAGSVEIAHPPAAPTPEQVECPSCKHWVDMPAPAHPPWAPEPAPDMPEDQRALIDSYMAQPAAPEPSAEPTIPPIALAQGRELHILRLERDTAEAQLAAERESHQATRDIAEIYRTDLNAAEAQLAAVRDIVADRDFTLGRTQPVGTRIQRIERLLTAPSPGAGKETL